jgi:type II secretory pathway pseudopilin PulG
MLSGKRPRWRQLGMTYLVILFVIAISSAVLAATTEIWLQQQQRRREAELLWIGRHFAVAIEQYYQHSPGSVKRFPEKLDDLLEDRRQLAITRYLRKIYADPMTGSSQWGLVMAPQGGIMGVFSLSQKEPIKVGGFQDGWQKFNGAKSYTDWKFIFEPPL